MTPGQKELEKRRKKEEENSSKIQKVLIFEFSFVYVTTYSMTPRC